MGELDRAPKKVHRVFYWTYAGMMILAALVAIGHAILG
jgi:hypothetical protein